MYSRPHPGWLRQSLSVILAALLGTIMIVLAIQPFAVALAQPTFFNVRSTPTTIRLVTSTADSGVGTLRQAIDTAATGDTIQFSLTYPAVIITSQPFTITTDLTIDGPGAANLTLSGNNTHHVFYIASTANISGVTIANGYDYFMGGGIYNLGTLTLTHSTLLSNTAGTGGGLYNDTGAVTLINSTVINNAAKGGGGIDNYYGTLTLIDSTIVNNLVSGNGGGGGIHQNDGILTALNSTLSRNTARLGGGISVIAGTLLFTNTVIVSNTAEAGGGIYNTRAAFTLVNSTVMSNTASNKSGGIFNDWGTFVVTGSTLLSNTASNGGGGFYNNTMGTFILTDSFIAHNSAHYGGGFYNIGTLALGNSTLSSNQASNYGGGFYSDNTMTLVDSVLERNAAATGGGLYNRATLTVTNSTVSNNSAVTDGGGVYNYGTLTLIKSTVMSNTANDGGGIYTLTALTLTNSTVSGNSALNAVAGYGGGGIVQNLRSAGRSVINYSTIANNSAESTNQARSGIWINMGEVILANSLVANNNGANNYSLTGGTFTSQGYNVSNDWNGLSTQTTDRTGDPLLAPLADNGGTTWTHALLAGSSAINQIPVGTHGCGTTFKTDQRGWPRPALGKCDSGAHEEPATHFLHLPLIIK